MLSPPPSQLVFNLTSFGGPDDCAFLGVYERLGTFHVSVTKPGYYPGETTVVIDEADDCGHVTGKQATVTLKPL